MRARYSNTTAVNINPRVKPITELPPGGGGAFSLATFCVAHNLSRSYLYLMLANGTGPETMRLGGRVLISYEAAAAWRARMTQTGSPTTEVKTGTPTGVLASANTPAGAK